MGWMRPLGPPRVWHELQLVNLDGKQLNFIIQEIPEDRYDEVLEHMCTSFVREEAMLSSMNVVEDPDTIMVIRKLWTLALNKGISIGAFEKNENNGKLELAGLNILVVVDDEFDEKMNTYDISNVKAKNFFKFIFAFSNECDPRKLFNCDKYLAAFGLSVLPKYRGLGLGKHLLKTRNDIGRLYNISLTGTTFTSSVSQKIAISVGFEVYLDRAYDDIVDEEGKKMFPSLTGERIKIMIKHLL